MLVNEVAQVLADDEKVKQLLMNDLELGHGCIRDRIVNLEQEAYRRAGLQNQRDQLQLQRILDRFWNPQPQRHTATWTLPRCGRAHIRIHRTVIIQRRRRRRHSHLPCSGKDPQDGYEEPDVSMVANSELRTPNSELFYG